MPLSTNLRLSRRRFLMGVGASSVTAATAGAGVFFNQQGSAPNLRSTAYQLWTATRQGMMSDMEYMALCGHLAASPHNTQPWTFAAMPGGIRIEADMSRNIGMADPERRQLHQGIGCAVENVVLAAGYLGYDTEVSLPGNDAASQAQPAVMVMLRKQPAGTAPKVTEAAFQSIFARSTNRAEYDMSVPVPSSLLDQIAADVPADAQLKLALHGSENAAYVTAALRRSARHLVRDEAFYQDSMRWWRRDRAALEVHGDGISILSTDMPPTVKGGMAAIVSDAMWTGEFGKRGEIGGVDSAVNATPVWGVIANKAGTLAGRIQAGRLLERVYLRAAEVGMAVHPLNYPVEHPEIARQLHYRFGFGENAEMLTIFRLGKGPETEKSPRRPLQNVLV